MALVTTAIKKKVPVNQDPTLSGGVTRQSTPPTPELRYIPFNPTPSVSSSISDRPPDAPAPELQSRPPTPTPQYTPPNPTPSISPKPVYTPPNPTPAQPVADPNAPKPNESIDQWFARMDQQNGVPQTPGGITTHSTMSQGQAMANQATQVPPPPPLPSVSQTASTMGTQNRFTYASPAAQSRPVTAPTPAALPQTQYTPPSPTPAAPVQTQYTPPSPTPAASPQTQYTPPSPTPATNTQTGFLPGETADQWFARQDQQQGVPVTQNGIDVHTTMSPQQVAVSQALQPQPPATTQTAQAAFDTGGFDAFFKEADRANGIDPNQPGQIDVHTTMSPQQEAVNQALQPPPQATPQTAQAAFDLGGFDAFFREADRANGIDPNAPGQIDMHTTMSGAQKTANDQLYGGDRAKSQDVLGALTQTQTPIQQAQAAFDRGGFDEFFREADRLNGVDPNQPGQIDTHTSMSEAQKASNELLYSGNRTQPQNVLNVPGINPNTGLPINTYDTATPDVSFAPTSPIEPIDTTSTLDPRQKAVADALYNQAPQTLEATAPSQNVSNIDRATQQALLAQLRQADSPMYQAQMQQYNTQSQEDQDALMRILQSTGNLRGSGTATDQLSKFYGGVSQGRANLLALNDQARQQAINQGMNYTGQQTNIDQSNAMLPYQLQAAKYANQQSGVQAGGAAALMNQQLQSNNRSITGQDLANQSAGSGITAQNLANRMTGMQADALPAQLNQMLQMNNRAITGADLANESAGVGITSQQLANRMTGMQADALPVQLQQLLQMNNRAITGADIANNQATANVDRFKAMTPGELTAQQLQNQQLGSMNDFLPQQLQQGLSMGNQQLDAATQDNAITRLQRQFMPQSLTDQQTMTGQQIQLGNRQITGADNSLRTQQLANEYTAGANPALLQALGLQNTGMQQELDLQKQLAPSQVSLAGQAVTKGGQEIYGNTLQNNLQESMNPLVKREAELSNEDRYQRTEALKNENSRAGQMFGGQLAQQGLQTDLMTKQNAGYTQQQNLNRIAQILAAGDAGINVGDQTSAIREALGLPPVEARSGQSAQPPTGAPPLQGGETSTFVDGPVIRYYRKDAFGKTVQTRTEPNPNWSEG